MPPRNRRLNLVDQAADITPTTTSPDGPRLGLIAALAAVPDTTNTVPTELPVADLVAHPHNVRGTDLGDLSELADSIRGSGVIMPLVVAHAQAWQVHHPGQDLGGLWVIIAGHRRHAAALLAGLETVPVVVRDDLADPAQTTTAMLIENIHRQDLAPLDEAGGLAALVEAGLSQRDISRRTGISQAQVSKRLTLLKLSDRGKAALGRGAMSVDTALALLKLPAKIRDIVLTSGARPDIDIAGRVHRALIEVDDKRRHDQVVASLKAEGVTVVESLRDLDGEQAHAFLYAPDDIAAARAAGLAFAHVAPWARNLNNVSWYCTQAPPWPWQPSQDDADTANGGLSDSSGITPADPVEDAAGARQQYLRGYLTLPLADNAAAVLAQLVLINSRNEPGWHGIDLDLVDLLGAALPDTDADMDAHETFLEIMDADLQTQLRYALANQFARGELGLTRHWRDRDGQLRWDLGSPNLAYLALVAALGHPLSPVEHKAFVGALSHDQDHPGYDSDRQAAIRAGVTVPEQ